MCDLKEKKQNAKLIDTEHRSVVAGGRVGGGGKMGEGGQTVQTLNYKVIK